MDDTQKYLNEILKKRLGSIPNYGAASKNPGTVMRLPKQQEKVQNMPTVFRKKHQTVIITQSGYTQQQYPQQIRSQYMSIKQGSMKSGLISKNQISENNRQTQNQRVEYMLISKRIQSKKQDDFISPTVDVTKYANQSSSLKSNTQSQANMTKTNRNSANNVKDNQLLHRQKSYEGDKPKERVRYEQEEQMNPHRNTNNSQDENRSMMSNLSNVDKSKRKRIFMMKQN